MPILFLLSRKMLLYTSTESLNNSTLVIYSITAGHVTFGQSDHSNRSCD